MYHHRIGFRMSRVIFVIKRRFHLDLLEKSIRLKYCSMSVQQPAIRNHRTIDHRWPELVYKLGLFRNVFYWYCRGICYWVIYWLGINLKAYLSWTNSQALFNRSNFYLMNSEEFQHFIRPVFDPSDMTLTDIGAGNGLISEQLAMIFRKTSVYEPSILMRRKLKKKRQLNIVRDSNLLRSDVFSVLNVLDVVEGIDIHSTYKPAHSNSYYLIVFNR